MKSGVVIFIEPYLARAREWRRNTWVVVECRGTSRVRWNFECRTGGCARVPSMSPQRRFSASGIRRPVAASKPKSVVKVAGVNPPWRETARCSDQRLDFRWCIDMRCEPAFERPKGKPAGKLGVWIEIGEIACERAKNVDPSGQTCKGHRPALLRFAHRESYGGRQGPACDRPRPQKHAKANI